MTTTSLRKSGGSLTVTMPPLFLKKNGLGAGAQVQLAIKGDTLTISPARKKITLKDILAAAPKRTSKLRAPGWDELAPAGKEA